MAIISNLPAASILSSLGAVELAGLADNSYSALIGWQDLRVAGKTPANISVTAQGFLGTAGADGLAIVYALWSAAADPTLVTSAVHTAAIRNGDPILRVQMGEAVAVTRTNRIPTLGDWVAYVVKNESNAAFAAASPGTIDTLRVDVDAT